jgi:hypothetical protein
VPREGAIPDVKLAVLAAAGLLSACCGGAPISQFPTPDDALTRMHASFDCTVGVRGTAKVDYFGKQGRVKSDVDLTAVVPDRLRFTMDKFGVLVYALTTDGKSFQMLDNQEKVFLDGPAKACNVARFTRVPIPPFAMVSLLRGEAPVLAHGKDDVSMEADDGSYLIKILGKHQAVQEIGLEVVPADRQKPWNAQRVRVTDVKVTQAGVVLYQAELGDHEPIATSTAIVDEDGLAPDVPPIGGACEAEVPKRIRMYIPNTSDDVVFDYQDVKWNPPLLPGTFGLVRPGGIRQEYVDCSDIRPLAPPPKP